MARNLRLHLKKILKLLHKVNHVSHHRPIPNLHGSSCFQVSRVDILYGSTVYVIHFVVLKLYKLFSKANKIGNTLLRKLSIC